MLSIRLAIHGEWVTDADRDLCMLIRDELSPTPVRKFGPLPKRPLTEREQRYKNLIAWPEIGSRQALVIGIMAIHMA